MRQDRQGDAMSTQMTYTQVGQNSVFGDGLPRPFTLESALYRLPFGHKAKPWSAGQRNRFYSYKMLHQVSSRRAWRLKTPGPVLLLSDIIKQKAGRRLKICDYTRGAGAASG